jgi:NADH-quinone oxidoreductase subunit J
VLAVIVALSVVSTDWGDVSTRLATATDALARLLFNEYILPFEIVSVLLLAAVIGGVFLAKREDGDA